MDRPDLSHGSLLGGKVRYSQPASGYRTGIEPVLLAASLPAQPGERVVEAGTGAGAGLLALWARLGSLEGLGLEKDPVSAGLARDNLAANGVTFCRIATADVTTWRTQAPFDHAFANPPWHDSAGTPSPMASRRQAKFGADGLLAAWAASLAHSLRRRGTLSFILPASSLAAGISALAGAGCPEISVLPLWPRAGLPARLVILCGVKLGRGPGRLLSGLTLHGPGNTYTEHAERVLRHGQSIAEALS